ncbi:MAG: DNA-binding NarL/FixJ family response regulator [Planctomycetota bacterium]|jgi:DNA-binding NarL/FixJ family response regulator
MVDAIEESQVTKPTRILLVDDHELVRTAMCGLLERDSAYEVVGECSNAGDATSMAMECQPEILVMDIDMPGMICFDAVKQITERLPELKVIFLSAFFHDHYIEQALAVGAKGYLVKGDPPRALFQALEEVSKGGVYFSNEVKARFALDKDGKPDTSKLTVTSTLTNREVEVLRYLARGLSKKEIAKTMHLSVKTVEHHSASVMRKLDIHDRVELARYAIREGLAEP